MSFAVTIVLASCLSFVLAANDTATQVAKTTTVKDDKSSLLSKMPVLEMLKNPKVVEGYTRCLLDKGPCTPDAAEVKGLMPNALTQGCSKCSPIQKKVTNALMLHYNEKAKETYKQVTAKYDPKGEFSKKYLAKLKTAAKKE